MRVCDECWGFGKLQHEQRVTPAAPGVTPSGTFYGDNKQWAVKTCPTCLGTGINKGAGT